MLERKSKKWRNDESLGQTKAIRMMVGVAIVVQHLREGETYQWGGGLE